MPVLETPRLSLRQLRPDDAAFIQGLVNDPDWLRFIGDRGVRTLADACKYLERGPIAMYARLGFAFERMIGSEVDPVRLFAFNA